MPSPEDDDRQIRMIFSTESIYQHQILELIQELSPAIRCQSLGPETIYVVGPGRYYANILRLNGVTSAQKVAEPESKIAA